MVERSKQAEAEGSAGREAEAGEKGECIGAVEFMFTWGAFGRQGSACCRSESQITHSPLLITRIAHEPRHLIHPTNCRRLYLDIIDRLQGESQSLISLDCSRRDGAQTGPASDSIFLNYYQKRCLDRRSRCWRLMYRRSGIRFENWLWPKHA